MFAGITIAASTFPELDRLHGLRASGDRHRLHLVEELAVVVRPRSDACPPVRRSPSGGERLAIATFGLEGAREIARPISSATAIGVEHQHRHHHSRAGEDQQVLLQHPPHLSSRLIMASLAQELHERPFEVGLRGAQGARVPFDGRTGGCSRASSCGEPLNRSSPSASTTTRWA